MEPSYEIEFIGSGWAADILMEALRMGRLQAEIEVTERGFRCRVYCREEGKILISCSNAGSDGCVAIVNAKHPESGKIVINADAIARSSVAGRKCRFSALWQGWG